MNGISESLEKYFKTKIPNQCNKDQSVRKLIWANADIEELSAKNVTSCNPGWMKATESPSQILQTATNYASSAAGMTNRARARHCRRSSGADLHGVQHDLGSSAAPHADALDFPQSDPGVRVEQNERQAIVEVGWPPSQLILHMG